jgi:hypothetical protein
LAGTEPHEQETGLGRSYHVGDNLDAAFAWKEERTVSQALTLQSDKVVFILELSEQAKAAIGKRSRCDKKTIYQIIRRARRQNENGREGDTVQRAITRGVGFQRQREIRSRDLGGAGICGAKGPRFGGFDPVVVKSPSSRMISMGFGFGDTSGDHHRTRPQRGNKAPSHPIAGVTMVWSAVPIGVLPALPVVAVFAT